MTYVKFLKTLTAAVALTATFYPQAWATDTGSCGTNCVYSYENGTLTFTGTGTNGAGKIEISVGHYGLSGTVKNAVISEGITEIVYDGSGYNTLRNIGTHDGKLTIPSTMEKFDEHASYLMRFGTIEINSTNIDFKSLEFASDANPTIVLSPNNNINFTSSAFYEAGVGYQYPANINIACKGNPDDCLSKFSTSLDNMTGTITADYYKGLNSDGNYEEWSASGHAVYADSSKQKILSSFGFDGSISTYDSAGNITAQYDKNGRLIYGKKIYTIPEAEAATQKGNVNSVSITW